MGALSSEAEALGFDGVWVTEVTHSPWTLLTEAARPTTDIDVGSAIAVAFPRSPMVTAYTAWDLQRLAAALLDRSDRLVGPVGVGSTAGGGLQLLPPMVGEKRARDVLLTGRLLDAEEVQEWGCATGSWTTARPRRR